MQKKLIAAAVAGALATPVAIADVMVGGSIRNGVYYDGSEWAVVDNASRLHFRSSADLGNGQSAFMNYEFTVKSAQGSIGTGDTQRLTFVGLKGDWGSLSLGSQWSTVFNTVGTFCAAGMYHGGICHTGSGGQYRMKDSVYLSTNLGGFSVSGDLQMNSDSGDDLDRATIGTNINIGAISIGAAWQDNGSNDFTGIGASMDLAGVALSGAFTSGDTSGDGFGVNAKIAGIKLGYEEHDSVADGVVWGNYSLGLGGGTFANFEIGNDGTDTTGIAYLQLNF